MYLTMMLPVLREDKGQSLPFIGLSGGRRR
jgi:hypothetical protein